MLHRLNTSIVKGCVFNLFNAKRQILRLWQGFHSAGNGRKLWEETICLFVWEIPEWICGYANERLLAQSGGVIKTMRT